MAQRSNPAMKIAQKTAHNAMFDADGKPKAGVHNMLLRAVEIQRRWCWPTCGGCSANTRTPPRRQLAAIQERNYLAAVTAAAPSSADRPSSPASAPWPPWDTPPPRRSDSWKPPPCTQPLWRSSTAYAWWTRRRRAPWSWQSCSARRHRAAELPERPGGRPGQGPHPGLGDAVRAPRAADRLWLRAQRIQRAFLRNLLKRQGTALLGRRCRRSASAPWWAASATG